MEKRHSPFDPPARRARATPPSAVVQRKLGKLGKLTMGATHDPLEQEADRVADHVVTAPAPSAAGGAPPPIQLRPAQTTAGTDAAPATVDRVLAGSGKPLDDTVQRDMAQRFGRDFSHVRVHAGAAAEESARDVNANAYTVGSHVVFGAGRFAPATHAGQRLIAHELTHVVQQSGAGGIQGEHGARIPTGGGAPAVQRDAADRTNDPSPTGMPAVDSMGGSLTVDSFASDSAELTPAHKAAIARYKARVASLLERYPDSFISVVGHTDATDTEAHNQALGQERAEAVMAALSGGEFAIPVSIMRAASLGKTQLKVAAQGREARNRRVDVMFTARKFGWRNTPEFKATPPFQGGGYKMPKRPGPIMPPGPDPDPQPDYYKPVPPAPKQPDQKNILEWAFTTIVDPVINATTSWLPKAVQAKIRELAHEAVEKGILDRLESGLSSMPLSPQQREAIKKSVEAAIKRKNKPFDRKDAEEGSPHHREGDPSHVPEKPDDSQWK